MRSFCDPASWALIVLLNSFVSCRGEPIPHGPRPVILSSPSMSSRSCCLVFVCLLDVSCVLPRRTTTQRPSTCNLIITWISSRPCCLVLGCLHNVSCILPRRTPTSWTSTCELINRHMCAIISPCVCFGFAYCAACVMSGFLDICETCDERMSEYVFEANVYCILHSGRHGSL